jgi:hypothetical protein
MVPAARLLRERLAEARRSGATTFTTVSAAMTYVRRIIVRVCRWPLKGRGNARNVGAALYGWRPREDGVSVGGLLISGADDGGEDGLIVLWQKGVARRGSMETQGP